MSWAEFHRQSEQLASEADTAVRLGDRDRATELYARAAEAETRALSELDPAKTRTLGISTVSATALWYKAHRFDEAQAIAYQWLATGQLPLFAQEQLKNLLQSIWSEIVRERARVKFAPDQVTVSVKGGEVVEGGAPLDLIVEKVQTVQSLFYRTAEYLKGLPHRRRGAPAQDIQQTCRPWIFQAAPGSYQFAVAVQEPKQIDLFKRVEPRAEEIAERFLKILRASVDDPGESLRELVPDREYRTTFLKLTRNLAPTGKTFEQMEIQAPAELRPITLVPAARRSINQAIRENAPERLETAEQPEETVRGILRALHLDQDWLEITVDLEHVRVIKVSDAVDDVIGPLVNRPVLVQVIRDERGRLIFRDIEPDE